MLTARNVRKRKSETRLNDLDPSRFCIKRPPRIKNVFHRLPAMSRIAGDVSNVGSVGQ